MLNPTQPIILSKKSLTQKAQWLYFLFTKNNSCQFRWTSHGKVYNMDFPLSSYRLDMKRVEGEKQIIKWNKTQ